MPAQLLNGRQLSQKIRSQLSQEVAQLKKQGRKPYLVSLQIGENLPSQLYIENQKRSCREIGILFAHYELDGETPQSYLVDEIESLNQNRAVTGIILQLPLPRGLDPKPLYSMIHPQKDVEGMHPENLGRLTMGRPTMVPCTAMGAFEMIRSTDVDLAGKDAVVVGHSEIVGKPISLLLLGCMVTTTICHVATKNLKDHTSKADILVVAAGKPGLITADMVKPGSIIIDIGINRVPVLDEEGNEVVDEKGRVQKRTVGDVDPAVEEVAAYLTPVPGGVGPMTVAMLLKNTVQALNS